MPRSRQKLTPARKAASHRSRSGADITSDSDIDSDNDAIYNRTKDRKCRPVRISKKMRRDRRRSSSSSSTNKRYAYGRPVSPPPPPRPIDQHPQKTIAKYWRNFVAKKQGQAISVLPKNSNGVGVSNRKKNFKNPKSGVVQGCRAAKSYEQARDECFADVEKIVKECERLNQKYRDPFFDLELDLKMGKMHCLYGLERDWVPESRPKGVKRVADIFEKPSFVIDGFQSTDVRQGRDGDCWFLAALCTLAGMDGLIKKLCVHQNERVGVYGFVFFRDGEWQQTIIDDKLYLAHPDYDDSSDARFEWNYINRKDAEAEYRKAYQTGSRALFFSKCDDENETWLPLLEKAYAKAHGDYASIDGGCCGEGIEDLTGGATTEILTAEILDKDRFWTEELLKVNIDFLFGCGVDLLANWHDRNPWGGSRRGIIEGHAYSVLECREVKGERLLKIRNPWGHTEWNGPWSDGSAEWTPEWMELLGHKFGDDGVYWMCYKDFLEKYEIDRTRIFDKEWLVVQQWATFGNIPWTPDYHDIKFALTVAKEGSVVLMLSQLDDRYFKGLEGDYQFFLQFRLEREGSDDYIVRSLPTRFARRSTSIEVTLEPGKYVVLVKVTAQHIDWRISLPKAVKQYSRAYREKFMQIGLSYDLAHAKGRYIESAADKERIKEYWKKETAKEKARARSRAEKNTRKQWNIEKKLAARSKRQVRKKQDADAARDALKPKARPPSPKGVKIGVNRNADSEPGKSNIEITVEINEEKALSGPASGDRPNAETNALLHPDLEQSCPTEMDSADTASAAAEKGIGAVDQLEASGGDKILPETEAHVKTTRQECPPPAKPEDTSSDPSPNRSLADRVKMAASTDLIVDPTSGNGVTEKVEGNSVSLAPSLLPVSDTKSGDTDDHPAPVVVGSEFSEEPHTKESEAAPAETDVVTKEATSQSDDNTRVRVAVKPEEAKSEEVKPEEPKPEEAKSEEPKPEKAKSEEPKPEEAKSEEPKPEEAKSEEPKPEEAKSEEPKPEEAKSEDVKPEEVKVETAESEAPGCDDKTEPKTEESAPELKSKLGSQDLGAQPVASIDVESSTKSGKRTPSDTSDTVGRSITEPAQPTPVRPLPPPPPFLEPPHESDIDSFRDFEFDSELDMVPDSDEMDSEDEKATDDETEYASYSDLTSEDGNEDDTGKASGGKDGSARLTDPENSYLWNAVVTLGLRVYSKDKELTLEVVRPMEWDEVVDNDGVGLDRDDPAAAAEKREGASEKGE